MAEEVSAAITDFIQKQEAISKSSKPALGAAATTVNGDSSVTGSANGSSNGSSNSAAAAAVAEVRASIGQQVQWV